MAKSAPYILISLGLVFLALMAGYFLGRNSVSSPIQISKIPTTSTSVSTEKVNINTASAEQLQTLPGIGAVLAQRIVDYREAHGLFDRIEDLTMVEDIGLDRLVLLKDYVTV